jgi:hypothetical protein
VLGVRQDEATKKKSPKTTNNRPARAALGAAPTSRHRSAPRTPRATGSGQLRGRHVSRGLQHPPPGAGQLQRRRVSPTRGSSGGNTRLLAQISSGGAACHRLKAARGPARVPWTPAPASRRRTAPGVPRVPAAPSRRKNIGLSSSEIELRTTFLAPAAWRRAAPRAPRVPAALGRMKTVEPMQKT